MRKSLVLTVVATATLAAPAAWALPTCSDALLTTYLAAGYSCATADATLSNFTLTASAGGGATAFTGANIEFDPFIELPGQDGFDITAPGGGAWTIGAGQSETFSFSFTYTLDPGWVTQAYGWVLLAPDANANGASQAFQWSIMGAGFSDLESSTCATGTCNEIADDFFGPPDTSLSLIDSFTLNGGTDGASSGGVFEFSAPTGTPEPGMWALMFAGLAGLGAALRSRRQVAG